MKNIIIALFTMTTIVINAQTTNNVIKTNATVPVSFTITNESKGMPMELTLGGSGITIPKTGETGFGLNFTVSAQPLKKPIWIGISQEVGWSPSFAGATDLYVDWATPIIKEKLYLNTGWSVGAVYDNHTIGWRTGPEISLEYYTSGNAFVFVGANYDLATKSAGSNWQAGGNDSGLRYGFGVGIAF